MNATQSTAMACIFAGISVIKIKAGSKIPQGSWKQFQTRRMVTTDIKRDFPSGCNIALIGGDISGNLGCLDFDKPDLFQPFLDTLESVNPALRAKLTVWQETPSGGYHIVFRCTEPVGGNAKLAMSARYKDSEGKPRQDVFIETRGEGGYFLVAPSVVDGKKYTLHGSLEAIPVLLAEERDILHAIAKSFDESAQEAPQQAGGSRPVNGNRPGDRFNRENEWQQLLESEGWSFVKQVGDQQHWRRPGKQDGTSATLHLEKGLYCWSSNTTLPPQKPLDKFAFYTHCRFNGDFHAAAASLKDSDNSDNSDRFRQIRQIPTDSESFRQIPTDSDKSRSFSKDVLDYIESEPAPFTNNDLYSELCAKTRSEKKAICDALTYYKKLGKINSIEGRRGHWEVVEGDPEVMDLLAASTEPFNILLPLGISDHVRVRPGSIILVSGASNAGKTVFLLWVVRNFFQDPHIPPPLSNERIEVPRLTYLNSEMSAGELVTRIKGFGDAPTTWAQHVKFIERSHSFDKLVDPDGATFVDYLEVNEDFFNAGRFLAEIHRRLKGGVAVVAMQKKQGATHAKGGEMTLEKPRLALNLDKNEPHGFVCKITKAKEPVNCLRSLQGMERDFVITDRSEILPISDWRFVNESQRKMINAEYSRTHLPDLVKRDRVDYRTGQPIFSAAPEFAEEGVL